MPAGTIVNVADLFSGGGSPPSHAARSTTAPSAPQHPPPEPQQPQQQRQRKQGAGGKKDGGEGGWKARDDDSPSDEARPYTGPPTLLPINPPPPGVLQLKGERTNSTVAVPEGTMPVGNMRSIDGAAAALANSLKASDQEHAELRSTFARVQDMLQQIRPDGTVRLLLSAC